MAAAAQAAVRTLTLKAAGCPDFKVDVDLPATVADVKVAAVACCDIDPEAMRLIFKGKVLRDEDDIDSCGLDGSLPLHIARGKPASAASTSTSAASPSSAAATQGGGGGYADGQAASQGGGGSWTLQVKGPGAAESTLSGVSPTQSVAELRAKVAQLCGLPVAEIHMLHKAKVLKDDGSAATVQACGLRDGDIVRVARRAVQQEPKPAPKPATGTLATSAADASSAMPMPMAWSDVGMSAETERMVRHMMNVNGATPEQVANAIAAADFQQRQLAAQAARRQQPVGLMRDEAQERLHQEVRLMERQVRLRLRERLNGEVLGVRAAREVEEDEEDPELLADIARVMADSRARGAPVPDIDRFVDRGLERARQRRARQEQLRREQGEVDPDLEDAVAAAERVIAAASKAPRKLGGGDTS
eukprot:TRINITY_DN58752_c0_g1_i1.p1 TRINITY_DN58752_c0_g1~~TRINITY_DN58752_c0_g1_i1.p1  ORF type:complete len:417 (+),score=138.75 TRINITY_DN58752_c0_g1_i1:111-1361(+)